MTTSSAVGYPKAAIATWVLAIAVSSAATQVAQAQATNTSKSNDEVSEIIIQAERAVTATKTDTPLLEIPQSITVVTAQQIIDQGAQNLLSALQYTAGVSNAGDDTRGDFDYLRGFWAVNYLDGLKREFGFVYLPRSEVYALERADVLAGPSAVLYGAGSSGGLVNMQCRRPVFKYGCEVTASYGTYIRAQFQLDVTGPLSDTFAARLTAVYRNSDMLMHFQP